MLRKPLVSAFVALALLRATSVLAQDGGPDIDNVRVRIGPLMMNPMVSITNVGIDHNVFNEPADKAPKEDFTFTVTPLSDFWLHLGPTWLTATLAAQLNWYDKYSSERSANNTYKVGWFAPGSRMNFRVDGAYIDARERPGFEIDTRAARKETNVSGALDFKTMTDSYLGVTAARRQTQFDEHEEYNGTNLRTALNLTSTSLGVNFRRQLTPLTSLTVAASRVFDKFEFSPDRDATSTMATLSAAFNPGALLKGGASIGFSNFKPDDPALPGFKGLVGSVDLTYVLLGSTRFAVTGGRSTRYSYDVNQPYYLQSQIGGSIAQQIFGPLDVMVRGDIAALDYRNRAGVTVAVPDRTDHVTTVGIGIGYHMGKDLRLSFNVDQNVRDTRVQGHQYEKFLIGTALTYGF
jgi:hypothetical protein